MKAAPVPRPAIPDHEVLRVIGRGSYGVIWLARTLTGRLRAIKVIDRANFDNERSFQREFDGMSAFEPISRAHAGFINILHVGRGDGFFYYIMELADGIDPVQPIDVATYEPRTLKSEIDRRGRLPTSECLAIGLTLTDALDQLHRHDLIHRDIKPANLIFVHGAPKLADIGLVTTSGQYSFVGTEGYVPPEGPGTAQADIFSLGKALYEITMGKDRLDFPEMATHIDEIAEKDHVLGLNEILLKACAAKPTRRYATAREMHADLLRLQAGRKPARRLAPALSIAGLAALAVGAGWLVTHRESSPPPVVVTTPTPLPPPISTPPPVARTGSLTITSEPSGGRVVVHRDNQIVRTGQTPLALDELPPGDYEIHGDLGLASTREAVTVRAGQRSTATLHFPTGNGTVKITSAPGGASVFEGDTELGRTPLPCENVPPGPHRYRIRLEGYKEATVEGLVHPEEQIVLRVRLEHNLGPEPGKPWTNSLGMVLVPLGAVRMSIWETRVRDFDAFCAATGRARTIPDFAQTPDDPAVLVSWRDAMDFCEWLTARERAEGRLSDRQAYRLPTDREWSDAVGLPPESGATPEKRDGLVHKLYPWGKAWPPPKGAGNYADTSLKKDFIPGYADGFRQTSPVGRFAPSATGLYDLGGNVWEWCSDSYTGGNDPHDWGVLRGGSYANRNRLELESAYRNVVSRDDRDVIYGFRCVLAEEAP
jgi:formylglycine-generating enzyme required for sulfatase activity/serine/threonine protein kinase